MKIFLDDERPLPDGYIGVETAKDCIVLLELCAKKGEKVEILSLDHDLGLIDPDTLEEETGYDVLCWLEENLWAMPEAIRLHTDNSSALMKMRMALKSIEKRMTV